MAYTLLCPICQQTPDDPAALLCPRDNSLLEVEWDFRDQRLTRRTFSGRGVWRYRQLLPVSGKVEAVTLQEGETPLYRCRRMEKEMGLAELYVKYEGMNPSGSFKDRGMTVGVTKARELGMKAVACASTGNTSASLSLYAAHAGMRCIVVLPGGKVALGKLAQALMHGAEVYTIPGNFDEALRAVREVCRSTGIYLLNSVNPYRLEGQKTLAYEVAEELNWDLPDWVVLPVGNAGNISAIYKGFKEFHQLGFTHKVPRMAGIQAAGAAPVAEAVAQGRRAIRPVESPETVATAIRIGNPVNAPRALAAISESKGTAAAVPDEAILEAQLDLAQREGIAVEPASAASIAGLRKLVEAGTIKKGSRVVCVATGHLLKDPEGVLRSVGGPVEITVEELIKKLKS